MMAWFTLGNLFPSKNKKVTPNAPVSIIIAVRNGAKSLPRLISQLSSQNHSGEMEFIFIDDESTDSSREIINKKTNRDSRFILEDSSNGDNTLSHKKRALDAGIKRAKNEWLLFTDVDCELNKYWVSEMATYFDKNIHYIVGYSEVESQKNWVTKFQSLDFLMLMVANRGTSNSGIHWASSGQNQAYRKSLFNSVNGFDHLSKYLQGDDSLFLQMCKKYKPIKIVFLDSIKSRVKARQEINWISLFKQRLRWAGDAKIMWKFNPIFFTSIFITFIHILLLLIMMVFGIFFKRYYLSISILFLTIHIISEFILYNTACYLFNKKIRLFDFIFWSTIHIPFVVILGISSLNPNKLSWRGR